MSSSTASSRTVVTRPSTINPPSATPQPQQSPSDTSSTIPVTPAVLRSIFASSRTPNEERSISRLAFFRFAGFLLSCLGIGLLARGRTLKTTAALLGVGPA